MNAEEITQLLDGLAERLTPAAQATFEMLVQRVFIEYGIMAIASVIGIVLCTVVSIYFWRVTNNSFQKDVEEYDAAKDSNRYASRPDSFDLWFKRTIGLIILCVPLFFAVVGITTATINLLTPEYAALMLLLEAI